MKNGAYGLFSLDGQPLSRGDVATVLDGIAAATVKHNHVALAISDPDRSATAFSRTADGFHLLLGSVTQPAEYALRLGLDRRAAPVGIAVAACDQWGADAAARLRGEWLLISWNAVAVEVTLTLSECARDDCFFAIVGGLVAIAPDLTLLSRLEWVDRDVDGDALMRSLARPPLRLESDDRTFLKGVRRAKPGHRISISVRGVKTVAAQQPPPPALRAISFEQAMRDVDDLLRAIVSERLANEGHVAVLLSGGLDSSLAASLTAEALRKDQRLYLLSSASPEGSGIPDETEWARHAASHLNLPIIPVMPASRINAYAPSARFFSHAAGPLMSPRHYLYEAFEDAASACGATLMVDGAYGELTVSSYGGAPGGVQNRARAAARRVLDRLGFMAQARTAQFADAFHVAPSPEGLAALSHRPERSQLDVHCRRKSTDPLGFEVGWKKTGRLTSATSRPDLRQFLPFRNRRLIELVASFPASFAVHDGAPRAMARALLKDRMPPRIANRQCKMAFSPTFDTLLRDHAAEARALIPLQRAAGAGKWVDLDWLDKALCAASGNRQLGHNHRFKVQGTAMAAEFFRWWQQQGAPSL